VAGEHVIPAEPVPSLRGKVLQGISWQVGAQMTNLIVRLAVGVVLARLLTPHEYGLAGMAIVFVGLLGLVTDPALGAALVQRADIDERDRSTVFWTATAGGVALTLVGVACAPLVGRFYGNSDVTPLFATLALGFTLTGLCVVPSALLTRELRYGSLQMRGIVGSVVGGAAAIVVAVLGYGAWAIIAQALTASVVSAALLWNVVGWRPRRVFSVERLRVLGGFGVKLLGSRVLGFANLNFDNLLVGRYLGSAALGAYSLAYNVMFAPMVRLGFPIQQVTAAAFSRLQGEPERLIAAWLRSKRLSAALLAPAFLGVLVVAPDLIPVVFGERWDAAIRVLQLLCIAGVAHSLVTLNWSALQASGRAGTLLRVNLMISATTVTAFAVGLHWGIDGVAGLYAVARWLLVLPDAWLTCRGLAVRTRDGLLAGAGTLPAALGMALLAAALRYGLVQAGVGQAVRLALVVLAGVVVYAVAVRVTAPETFAELRALLSRRSGTSRASSA
jgi:O-antigen/teichoic acid export membrane protein